MKREFPFALLLSLTLITLARSQTAGSIDRFMPQLSSAAHNLLAELCASGCPLDAASVGLDPNLDAVRLANQILREKDGRTLARSAVRRGGLWVSGDVTDALARLRWIAGPKHAELLHLGRDNQVTLNTVGLGGCAWIDDYSGRDAPLLLASHISSNEGLLLLLQLTESSHRYLLHIGRCAITPAGEGIVEDIWNLDNNFDSRINPLRRNNVKMDRERPPEGFDSLVAINPTTRFLNLRANLLLPPGNVTFHELAEAYAKVDFGLDYLAHGSCPGAHDTALAREQRLVTQRPLSHGVPTLGENRRLPADDQAPKRQSKRNRR